MCEFCGCGIGKPRPDFANAERVSPTLAAIPVRVIEPNVKSERVRQRKLGAKDPLLQQEPRTARVG